MLFKDIENSKKLKAGLQTMLVKYDEARNSRQQDVIRSYMVLLPHSLTTLRILLVNVLK